MDCVVDYNCWDKPLSGNRSQDRDQDKDEQSRLLMDLNPGWYAHDFLCAGGGGLEKTTYSPGEDTYTS